MNILIAAGIVSLGLVRPDPADLKPHLAPPRQLVFCACQGEFSMPSWWRNVAEPTVSVSWFCFVREGDMAPRPCYQITDPWGAPITLYPLLTDRVDTPIPNMLKRARAGALDPPEPLPCFPGEWSAY